MYKELATIKTGSEVTGFVVYDGTSTIIIDMDQAKKAAAEGNMDTLDYKDGKFIPIIQGETANELKRKLIMKRCIKRFAGMTFDEYVDNDCIFRKQDVDLMLTDNDIILANVCLAFEVRIRNNVNWMLTMSFWSSNKQAADRLQKLLLSYAPHIKTIYSAKNYDGFIIVNLPLTDPKCDFNLLTFQDNTGLNFLYNLDMMVNMEQRVKSAVNKFPFLYGKLMGKMIPTSGGLAGLTGVLREADRISSNVLSARGIDYYYET